MSPLSDDYIRSLEPEALRYDVTIFDDFVISVLPNGIKTWAFLYEYEGRKRRKTLGVYPDMSYGQAEDALDNVRGMIAKLGDDIKDSPVEDDTPVVTVPEKATASATSTQRPAVLASGLRKPHRPRKLKRKRQMPQLPKRWLKRLAIGIVVIIVLVAIALGLARLKMPGASSDTQATPTVPARAKPRPINVDDDLASSRPAPKPAPTSGNTAPRRQAPKPIILDDITPSSPPGPDVQRPLGRDTPRPDQRAAATPETTVEPSRADSPVAEVETATPVVPAPVEPGQTPSAADRVEPRPVDEPDTVVDPDRAPETTKATAAATVTQPVATEATARGGEVSRAVVTRNVVNLEPVDDIGENLLLNNDGYQTVFYFTELRRFSPGLVVHRWIHNGNVIADVPLRVDGGWRWRTYSSKDLLPGLTGDWRVELIDGDGRILGAREFRFDR